MLTKPLCLRLSNAYAKHSRQCSGGTRRLATHSVSDKSAICWAEILKKRTRKIGMNFKLIELGLRGYHL